jgi:2-oxopent-4-enoate/cis-2-oxohex-4-enoate hydratase
MNTELQEKLGDELYEALSQRPVLEPLSTRYPDIAIADAYAVQQHMLARRIAAGERVVGKKIGVTSKAVMDMLGVFQPDFGWLTDGMVFNEGEAVSASSLIQPKAEGEIAFLLKKTLQGPGVTAADVLAATEGVMACFEIVDSASATGRSRSRTRWPTTPAAASLCWAIAWSTRAMWTWPPAAWCWRKTARSWPRARALPPWAIRPMPWPGWPTPWAPRHCAGGGEVVLSGSLAAMVPVKAGDNLRVTIGGIGSCS